MSEKVISKKSQLLRNYLAETAKNIILNSGMKDLTIRKIAAEAGYAYTTIYNHFKNLDELLWLTRRLFMHDIEDYINQKTTIDIKNDEDVYEIFKAYTGYFIDNPNVYEFLYFHKLDKDSKTTQSYVETQEYEHQLGKTFEYLSKNKSPEQVKTAFMTILYSIQGLLTLAFSQNDDIGFDDVYIQLKAVIEYVLK